MPQSVRTELVALFRLAGPLIAATTGIGADSMARSMFTSASGKLAA